MVHNVLNGCCWFILKITPWPYDGKLWLYLQSGELLVAIQTVNVTQFQELKPRHENAISFLEHLLVSLSLNLAGWLVAPHMVTNLSFTLSTHKNRDALNMHMCPFRWWWNKQKKTTLPVTFTERVKAEENLHIFQFYRIVISPLSNCTVACIWIFLFRKDNDDAWCTVMLICDVCFVKFIL